MCIECLPAGHKSLPRVFQNISQIIFYLLWASKISVFENVSESLRELFRLPFEYGLQTVFDLGIAGSNTLTSITQIIQLPSQTEVFKEICKKHKIDG